MRVLAAYSDDASYNRCQLSPKGTHREETLERRSLFPPLPLLPNHVNTPSTHILSGGPHAQLQDHDTNS